MHKDRKKYTIIVVEDNAGDFFLLQDYLDEMILTPEIIHVASFKELDSYLASNSKEIDIVLLDLSLPDKRGEELIKETLKIVGTTPTVVLTGYPDFSFAVKSLGLGISDYLLKDDLSAATLYKSILYNIERNKNLVKLKESEHRYSDLFHLSPQPMWVCDAENFQFLDVNLSAVNHYGYTTEEFQNMVVGDIEFDDTETDLSSDPIPGNFEDVYKHKKKNGEVVYVAIRSNTIPYKGREAKVVLVNDITESLRHLKAIEQQNERLMEIAWTQSHEVRAPLARIMGLIQLISDAQTPVEEKLEMLSHVMDSANELDGIIRKIVKQSKSIFP
ncbi:pas/pac sensor protein [Flavobacterium saliperosum S13]|uniref:histidine kinase n=2 Tax=Flavobacterium saliperosum TaxID=329186 RepID=A0A1G4VPE5_9FLAO|nr:response regulator [Flavobacterium saliperosum]ESU23934.1 pas/pac sensor protein [Flavobacterium saliperosum S13]SCX09814.1 PAS domain S-box-containing protein [Flavobacterium saliperosum]